MDVLHCRRGWEEDKERIDLLELYLAFVSLGDFIQKSLTFFWFCLRAILILAILGCMCWFWLF